MLTSKFLACAAAKGSPNAQKKKRTRMMFSGRAAAAKANILFDTGASANFVSKTFAKQTGITVSVTVGRVSTARLLGMCGNHG
jgi:spermidine/putrescine-binding protein